MSAAERSAAEIVAAHYAAGARGELAGMFADLHPQVRWTEAAGFPYAGTYVGPQAVIDGVFAPIGRDWEDFRFELEELFAAGERVLALGHYRGRCRATASDLDVRTAHVWRVQGGQIVAFEQFTDTALVVRAMQGVQE